MRTASFPNWQPANLDRIQQLASAASLGCSAGDIGYSQRDLLECAEREAREHERLAREYLEEKRRQEQEEQERSLLEEKKQRDTLAKCVLPRQPAREQDEAEAFSDAASPPSTEPADIEVPSAAVQPGARSPEVEVFSDDEEEDDFEVIDLDDFLVNDQVIVKEDIISDSEDGEELLRGERGFIVDIDADGDVYIRFKEHRKKQWVYSENLGFLSKVLFDVQQKVVVRRSFMCGPMQIRKRQQGLVKRVDAGGDVLIDFDRDIGELWVQYYSLVFMEEAPMAVLATRAMHEARLWLYSPPGKRDIAIRAVPDVEGPRTKLTLSPGQKFMVSEEHTGPDGLLYLKLADGSGWLFEKKLNSEVLCVRQDGGLPSSILGDRDDGAKDGDLTLTLDDAKEILSSMARVVSTNAVQGQITGLTKDLQEKAKKKDLSKAQLCQEMVVLGEKAKRILIDSCKAIIKDFGFELAQEGQEALIEELRVHERDDCVFCLATFLELCLQLDAGSWFRMSQLRHGAEVIVMSGGPSSLVGCHAMLESLEQDGRWRVQLLKVPGVQLLEPQYLAPAPAVNKEMKELQMSDENCAEKARELAALGAAKLIDKGGRVQEAPWWVAACKKAVARASTRMLEREYLALASGSEAAFAESLQHLQGEPAPLPIEDKPVLPLMEMLDDLDAEQVQLDFRSLACSRRRPVLTPAQADSGDNGGSTSTSRRNRKGAFSSCIGALTAHRDREEIGDEAEPEEHVNVVDLRAAEVKASRGDIRQLLRSHRVVGPRKDVVLRRMTGGLDEDKDPGLLAVEARNAELPPHVTRAQALPEAFERQKARWHLPPRGKHIGYMPQAHALGAGQGNLGALMDCEPLVPSKPTMPLHQDLSSFGGLPDFDDGPGCFKGSGFAFFS
eukprot:TRINITY_DN66480_c0_g1_i1.p1 TRINITY_DN66480_c0_g1~~TRINITY_DN66480_c0_g1_i1.p1  ORF type:complete len:895 (-),score=207.88 TRINITY_DN66480_c0_g1_i1:93-2777(-)